MLLQGIPGSGKTTFAMQAVRQDTRWKRVSRDDIRRMVHGASFDPRFEEVVTILERNCAFGLLMKGFNVIVDATHVKPKYIREWVEFVGMHYPQKVQVLVKRFDIPVSVCLERNAARPAEQRVPEYVVRRMYMNMVNMKL